MATLNLGRIKPVFRGAYAGGTAYVVDDIVTSGNETFICIQASTGNATSNASYWTKMAAKGTDGTDIGTTLTTQGDILYRDGSGLQRLAAGTSGQALLTGGAGANPSWGSVASKIYDVYYNESTAAQVITGNQYQWFDINGLSRTITPQSSSSKFWIHGRVTTGTDGNHTYIGLNCGGNLVHLSDAYNSALRTTSSNSAKTTWDMSDQTFAYLWSPATANAVTIKIQGAREGQYILINRSERDDGNTYDSRASSSLTIFEIAS